MIANSEFKQRRSCFIEQMKDNSAAVIPAATEVTRSNDTEYPFRQDSNFFYLTGFNEPDAWLLLSNKEEKPASIIICRDKDKSAEIWNGRRLGPAAVEKNCEVDKAVGLSELDACLRDFLDGHDHIYTFSDLYPEVDSKLKKAVKQLKASPKKGMIAPHTVVDAGIILDEMRLIKSAAEIEVMQKAADISVAAHKRAMIFAKPDVWEYQIEAEIQHEFVTNGARFVAYNSIVGGGDNACILHYTDNQDQLIDGDLLLIDAGCEYQGYAADITRTFPVNGKFSEEQKQLYQIVLDAQLAAIDLIKPGNTLEQATQKASEVITEGLINLGIMSGAVQENIENKNHKRFFPHGLGHWLGLDVHDVGKYKIDGIERVFEPGMVLTIEPGIYIDQDADLDEKWKGIGIRIEDNILVTDTGNRNLTEQAPKTIEDIEALMASG